MLDAQAKRYYKYQDLKIALQNYEKSPVVAVLLTGDCLSKMVQEIEEGRRFEIPYAINADKLAQQAN